MRWAARMLAAALVLAAGAGAAQQAPAKLALVIGNADYNGDGRIDVSDAGATASEAAGFVPDLRNPLNDAADIRDALTGIGFRVDFVQNADGAAMSTALASFGAKVAAAPDTAQVVIYYAGHAMQVDGANFLIPVKAQLPGLDYASMPSSQVQTVLRRVAVSTTEITEQFRALKAPGVNVLILDSCRNNPWEGRVRGVGRGVGSTRGLAEIAAPPRTVIAFSTAPGQTAADGSGRNSPFAAALKVGIRQPGTVLLMLDWVGSTVQTSTGGRQTPWLQSASLGTTCLSACSAPAHATQIALVPVDRRIAGFEALAKADVRESELPYLIANLAENSRGRLREAMVLDASQYYSDQPQFLQSIRDAAAYYGVDAVLAGFASDESYVLNLRGGSDLRADVSRRLRVISARIASAADKLEYQARNADDRPLNEASRSRLALLAASYTARDLPSSEGVMLDAVATGANLSAIRVLNPDAFFSQPGLAIACWPNSNRATALACYSTARTTRDERQCSAHWVRTLAQCAAQWAGKAGATGTGTTTAP